MWVEKEEEGVGREGGGQVWVEKEEECVGREGVGREGGGRCG